MVKVVHYVYDFTAERAEMTTIDDARSLIEQRLRDLTEEEQKLRKVIKHLSEANSRNGPGRPRGSRSAPQRTSPASGKPRRSRKGGTRAKHALGFIEKNPGSTATQVAEKLKIQPSYVYRVLGDLAKDGKIRKDGRAYWARR
jgi:CRP-like cAMP-binding protein